MQFMGEPERRRYRSILLQFLLVFAGVFIASTAHAQVDLVGEWAQLGQEDSPIRGDINIGNYTGLPIDDASRMRGDTWDAEQWTMVEHLCHAHPVDYAPRGPSQMRIWSDVDPLTQGVIAYHTIIEYMLPERIIYMDGRPHPPESWPHTWQGFSTGEWVGDMLKVTTTHMKEGYFRRNGVARSENATMTEYFFRDKDALTLVSIVDDPVYLTQPMVWTTDWTYDNARQLSPNYCISSVEIDHPRGWVAFHLPGQNPWLHEFSEMTGIPYEATRGGAETMYPEYQKKLATLPIPPKRKPDSVAGAK